MVNNKYNPNSICIKYKVRRPLMRSSCKMQLGTAFSTIHTFSVLRLQYSKMISIFYEITIVKNVTYLAFKVVTKLIHCCCTVESTIFGYFDFFLKVIPKGFLRGVLLHQGFRNRLSFTNTIWKFFRIGSRHHNYLCLVLTVGSLVSFMQCWSNVEDWWDGGRV